MPYSGTDLNAPNGGFWKLSKIELALSPSHRPTLTHPPAVIPAKAGTHCSMRGCTQTAPVHHGKVGQLHAS